MLTSISPRVRAAMAFGALCVVFASCSKTPQKDPADKIGKESKLEDETAARPPDPATLEDVTLLEDYNAPSELSVVLRDGSPPTGDAAQGLPRPKVAALGKADTDRLLSRMEDLVQEEGDQVDFAKRERSLPPPKTGDVIKASFPPESERARPAAVEADASAGLEVLRHAPDGDVPLAPHVSVTFNQPMVAITSHADTVAEGVPVEISPEVEGRWRWVGAKTLLFEADGARLPMATEYTVTVPAGAESKNGNALDEAVSWTFKTPAPKLVNYWPNYGTWPRDQVAFMEFDQRIDQQAMLKHITMKGGVIFGNRTPRLATADEIEDDPQIKQRVANAKEGRWLAIRAEQELPYGSNIRVNVKKGAPSAEGPLTTESGQGFSFNTYGPLVVEEHRCGWRGCRPQDNFYFRLSNALDMDAFDPSQVEVEPSFPAKNIYASGNYIYVQGRKPGRRKYKVTLSKDIEDRFGQKLGEDKTYTFEVGADDPMLSSNGGNFVVLDPSSEPGYTLFSINYAKLRVRAYEVSPAQWPDFFDYDRDWRYYGKHEKSPPGKQVMNEVITIADRPDEMVETTIALGEALGGDGLGHLVLTIEPVATMKGAEMPRYKPMIRTWVQATQLGLDAFVDNRELIGWATTLRGGEPMSGVKLSLGDGTSADTGEDGTATIALPGSSPGRKNYLMATKGKDVAMLPESTWGGSSSWYARPDIDRMSWFVFDDRKMYRPGEEVHVKGWARLIEEREGGDVALPEGATAMSYVVYGPMGNEITKGKADVSGLGGFDFKFTLPGTPNLGNARIQMSMSGVAARNTSHTHNFQIQEFRRPEFEVSASAPEGPHLAGGEVTATVSANYYAGGALPNADTTWQVTTSQASFTPPNQSKYTFGSWTPWWVTWNQPSSGQSKTETFQGKTDTLGEHHLDVELGEISPPRPMSVRAQATVMDVNRQGWTSTVNMLVHPSEHYVGLRTERYFVKKGEPLEVKVVASDIDGELLVERPVKVRAARTQWKWQAGKYTEELVDPQDCEVMTKADEVTCTFKTDVGGSYKITATTVDDHGRANFTQMTRWVSGAAKPPARRVEQERAQLIPDRDSFQPGDTARLLVQAPFTPAEALLSIRRNGIVEQRRFTMSEPTTEVEIPIKSGHVPNVHVQVDLVGSAPRLDAEGKADEKLPRRPAYAVGQIDLKVPPTERALDVAITPAADELEPGAKTSVSVAVKGADGKPVEGAEVAVVIVDESILALSSYAMADPLSLFYPSRPTGARDYHLRGSILLVDPTALQAAAQAAPEPEAAERSSRREGRVKRRRKKPMPKKSAAPAAPMDNAPMAGLAMEESKAELFAAAAPGGDVGGAAQPDTPIAVRSNFNPLAAFAPAVRTNASGEATIEVELPDNLTRYRVMAVAVEGGKRYGSGEGAVTARLPLMMRPSAPRFLNFGDKFELPVVVQNQTDKPMTVQLATRATNIELIKSSGWQFTVPADDRVEVRFPATTAMAGTARFQVAASAGAWADASEFELPVWTPATSEAFATYGVIDEGAIAQPVAMPGEVWPQFGGLEITTSSTALQALTDAFLYLYHYDYECAEQISSRVLSVAALRDVLSAFKAEEMPSPAEIKRSMSRDIEELVGRQNYDGGFGLWRKGQPSWPFVSLHAAHALARAEQKGYDVPDYNMNRAKQYLRDIERHLPGWYSEWTRRTIVAYALYVRNLMGERDVAGAKALIKRAGSLDGLSFETLGWLLGVMTGDSSAAGEIAELRRYLNNRVTETAGAAHYARDFSDGAYLIMHSDRRADAIVLEALIDDQPRSDLIPKIVQGLLAHRKRGRWGNTQENAFVLLALDKYFNTYEKQTPDFVARAWLGDTYAGEHKFKGRTTEQHQIDVPMRYLAEADGDQKLYLQKDGEGRMYYRVGMTYAPKSLFLEPADQGFVVERAYEPVDDDGDVSRAADGTWEIKAGAKVRIKLTMVAPTRRYHVALVDPMPAGLESLNPALATTGDLPQDPSMNTGRRGWWWWSRPWFEHQNMRDERTEAFTTLLWGGVHTYTYYARATTPGEFVVPPAKAEEMYSPETFGRSSSDRVRVVD